MRLFGVLLGEGNSKVGEVLNFSVPSVTTCPGASPWCLKHCYARRYERLRPACREAYWRNWELVQHIETFTETMLGAIPRIAPCFRIHVSGDFAGAEYIEAWYRVCQGYPKTRFWSYTRSWALSELLPPLERLRSLPNVQLLASTDPTMPLPPAGWRVAFVEDDPRARGMHCREQMGGKDSCLACGYCYQQDEGDVVFRVHQEISIPRLSLPPHRSRKSPSRSVNPNQEKVTTKRRHQRDIAVEPRALTIHTIEIPRVPRNERRRKT